MKNTKTKGNEVAYQVYKIDSEMLFEKKLKLRDIEPESAIKKGYVVDTIDCQLFQVIRNYYATHQPDRDMYDGLAMLEEFVLVKFPYKNKITKAISRDYKNLVDNGFWINDIRYVRLGAGAGQQRNNTMGFINASIADEVTTMLHCGITPEDWGNDAVVSKYSAYFGLSLSGFHALKTFPNVCVIEDFEEIKPHEKVSFLYYDQEPQQFRAKDTPYFEGISKPPEDGSEIETRLVDRIRIQECYYDEGCTIQKYGKEEEHVVFPSLNSFDGQGLMGKAWSEVVRKELGLNHHISSLIIRAPWIKGQLVCFDFHAYCKGHGVTRLKDAFGGWHNLDDVDVILSKSQFKAFKIYAQKGGWDYYADSMKKNRLVWGVCSTNKAKDSQTATMSYQYLNSLDLRDRDIEDISQLTVDNFHKLMSGDYKQVCEALSIDLDDKPDDEIDFDTPEKKKKYEPLFHQVLRANPDFLNDTYIQSRLVLDAKKRYTKAKYGKLLIEPSSYQRLIGDPVAQCQFLIREFSDYSGSPIEVKGLLPAHTIYSHYWNEQEDNTHVALFRSPMVSESEVLVRSVVDTPEMRRWYSTITSGYIMPIHCLSLVQAQGADLDGDCSWATNHPAILRTALKSPLPVIPESTKSSRINKVTTETLIESDLAAMNSRIGVLANECTGLYTKRALYPKNSNEYKTISEYITYYSILTGYEIDRVKTGCELIFPFDFEQWKAEGGQDPATNRRDLSAYSKEELDEFDYHNALAPDKKKPYFMRYVYKSRYEDRINKLHTCLNYEIKVKYKKSHGIDTLAALQAFPKEQRTEDMQRILDDYDEHFPLNRGRCAVNKICWLFENLQLKFEEQKGNKDMLAGYNNPNYITPFLAQVEDIAKRHEADLKIIRTSHSGNKEKAQKEIDNTVRERTLQIERRTKSKLLKVITPYSTESLFQHLYRLYESGKIKHGLVWNIMGTDMIEIVCKKGES